MNSPATALWAGPSHLGLAASGAGVGPWQPSTPAPRPTPPPPPPPPVLRGPRFSVHCLAPGIRRQRLQGPGGQKLELGRRLSLGDGCGGERWFLAFFPPGWAWRQRWGAGGGGRRGHPGVGGGKEGTPAQPPAGFSPDTGQESERPPEETPRPPLPTAGGPHPPGSRSPSDPAPPPSPSALNPAAPNPASTRLLHDSGKGTHLVSPQAQPWPDTQPSSFSTSASTRPPDKELNVFQPVRKELKGAQA
ncbi:unnamed protein product [Nyctereutes procyonoides]|uniref:(raccoon dog) hypothetical protein n=1 Tax=Nyctereutes procyonoides TaxID=34880 RepID=A0A811YB39_NYCPR|nr:unnamed protein product [Nyctereutes procyonoides]